VAIATPPGAGALGIIRLSGPDAVGIAAVLLPSPASIEEQPSHTIRHVRLLDPVIGVPIDHALCTVMRAPRSYTGEDTVELSCHGSPALLGMVVERLRRAGARLAAPGEFTRRAFVNGRLSLAQAEAVALLIGARTERAVIAAACALEGEVGTRVERLRAAVLDVIAGLEVSLDFPDEAVGLDAPAAQARVAALADEAGALLAAARRARLIHEGATVVLVGRPNAGKSSLLNALLGQDRAIVDATPGTTRDVVEGTISIGGVAVRVLDTAGLGAAGDAIEAEGMRRSRRAMDESDVVVLVVDASQASAPDDDLVHTIAARPHVIVHAKRDLPRHRDVAESPAAIAVSARTGAGLDALIARLGATITRLIGEDGEERQLAATLRQRAALEEIEESLRAAAGAVAGMPAEIALVDLHAALSQCSELLGLQVGDAVLDRIFAAFCVGK
jgi:tRNA modification GTPase